MRYGLCDACVGFLLLQNVFNFTEKCVRYMFGKMTRACKSGVSVYTPPSNDAHYKSGCVIEALLLFEMFYLSLLYVLEV